MLSQQKKGFHQIGFVLNRSDAVEIKRQLPHHLDALLIDRKG